MNLERKMIARVDSRCAGLLAAAVFLTPVLDADAQAIRRQFNGASRPHTPAPGPVSTPTATARAANSASITTGSPYASSAPSTASPARSSGHIAAHGQGTYANTWTSGTTTGGQPGGRSTQLGRAGVTTSATVTPRAYAPVNARPLAAAAVRDSSASRQSRAGKPASLGNAFREANAAPDRMYVSYIAIDKRTGRPYSGFASKPGATSPDEVLRYRYSGDFERFGGKPPRVVYSGYGAQGKATARGTEQLVYERYEARPVGTANRRNPVSERNRKRDVYLRQGQLRMSETE